MLPLKIGVFMDSLKLIHNRQFQFAFYVLLFFPRCAHAKAYILSSLFCAFTFCHSVGVWKIECFVCYFCICYYGILSLNIGGIYDTAHRLLV